MFSKLRQPNKNIIVNYSSKKEALSTHQDEHHTHDTQTSLKIAKTLTTNENDKLPVDYNKLSQNELNKALSIHEVVNIPANSNDVNLFKTLKLQLDYDKVAIALGISTKNIITIERQHIDRSIFSDKRIIIFFNFNYKIAEDELVRIRSNLEDNANIRITNCLLPMYGGPGPFHLGFRETDFNKFINFINKMNIEEDINNAKSLSFRSSYLE